MKSHWRQVEIELTPEQEPVWDETLEIFNRTSNATNAYYDLPVGPATKGKASLPFDIDIILELQSLLRKPSAHPEISEAISRQLSSLVAREKMF
jgi:hypothetical protein